MFSQDTKCCERGLRQQHETQMRSVGGQRLRDGTYMGIYTSTTSAHCTFHTSGTSYVGVCVLVVVAVDKRASLALRSAEDGSFVSADTNEASRVLKSSSAPSTGPGPDNAASRAFIALALSDSFSEWRIIARTSNALSLSLKPTPPLFSLLFLAPLSYHLRKLRRRPVYRCLQYNGCDQTPTPRLRHNR